MPKLIHSFQRGHYASSPLLIRLYVPPGTWVLEHAELGIVSGTASAAAFIQVVREGNASTLESGTVDVTNALSNHIQYDDKLTLEFGDEVRGVLTDGTANDVYELDVFIRQVA